MRKTTSDRLWIAVILFLLVAETVWLFSDLKWINLPFLRGKQEHAFTKEAGYIITAKKDLKRRGANSLIWEEAQIKDALFFYDSVLTLSQSAAKLYLKDQTDLELSENTLITLEEPEDTSKAEIRLRFSKGDLRARNPFAKTSVVGDEWLVSVEKGSDILLRKDQDSYEFEIVSGAATLQTKNGDTQLVQNKILKMAQDQTVKSVEKNKNLQWSSKSALRVYTFGDKAQVSLEWLGEPEQIIVNRAGNQEFNYPVAAKSLVLPIGSYKVRLQNSEGLSDAKTVEVWPAPHIYLQRPLPRDRIKTSADYEFIWSMDKEIKKYVIEFNQNGKPVRTEISDINSKRVQFDDEMDLQWSVHGEDEDGHRTPALYQNEIYLREEPLQAPKLKKPDFKKSEIPDGASFKHRSYWLWHLLFAQAHAKADFYEVQFEWEPVQNANQYVLEVSSTPDFRKPELIQNVRDTKFLWTKAKYKKYYWRVAAGTTKGRMGLFSEPSELQMDELQLAKKEETKTIVADEKISEQANPLTPVAISAPVEIVLPEIPSGWFLAYAPAFQSFSMTGEQSTKLNLSGSIAAAGLIGYKTNWINQANYQFSLWNSSQTWKPTPKVEYPDQSDLKISQTFVTFDRHTFGSRFGWGLVAHQVSLPKRETEQSIKIEQSSLFGGRLLFSDWIGISLLTSGNVNEAMLELQHKHYFGIGSEKLRGFVGGSGQFSEISHSDGKGSQSQFIFWFGLEQF